MAKKTKTVVDAQPGEVVRLKKRTAVDLVCER